MVTTADFRSVFYKQQIVAGVQEVHITDEHGLQRTYIYPNIRVVQPGETVSIMYNEWATMTDTTRWEPTGPT